jgi:hypothetical protein
MTVEYTRVDREFYERRLSPRLPERLVDIHTHVWLAGHELPGHRGQRRSADWAEAIAPDNPITTLAETYRTYFPDRESSAVVFGFPGRQYDIDAVNHYVAANAPAAGFHPLLLTLPEWDAAEFERRLDAGRFLGAKVYLNFAALHLAADEIGIFDFTPPHQLDVLNRRKALLILHIPRPGRLADSRNVADLLEIAHTWPDVHVVIAHVGRAYCAGDLGDSLAALRDTPSLLFDIAANTNAWVFEQAVRAVGPQRVLFGSDLPITRMRMTRVCEGDSYLNLVAPGAYPGAVGDPHMREIEPGQADRLTLFLYEEIAAFLDAADAAGLGRRDLEDVFWRNADHVLKTADAVYHSTRKA